MKCIIKHLNALQCHKEISKVIACIIILLLTTASACCEETEKMMDKQKWDTFLRQVQMSSWQGDDVSRNITCFDVNEHEQIAIGMEDTHNRCYISVYDNTGQWLYGYSFVSHGTYYLEWVNAENINIYWIRSSIKGTFDAQANCIMLTEYKLDSSMNKKFLYLASSEKQVKNSKYYLDTNLGLLSPLALGYARVLSLTPDGAERIIVDMTGSNIRGVIYIVCLIILIITAIIVAMKRYLH